MKVEFKENNKDLEEKIDYGTILLCKDYADGQKFSILRVSRPENDDPFQVVLHVLHSQKGREDITWGEEYNNFSDVIKDLKENYDVVQVVDAHIVIDKVIGNV